MLIVEDNVRQCQQLTNFISSNFNNIKLYSYVYTGQETLNLLANPEIDFILLDLNLPDISGIDIINHLAQNNVFKYKNSITIVSGEINMISKIIHNDFVYSVIYKPIDFNILSTVLNNFIKEKNYNSTLKVIKEKINRELNILHYNPSHKGTVYLSEAILYLYLNGDTNDNLTKDIYPFLALKYKTSINNVKCNILHSSSLSFYECDSNKFLLYFKLQTLKRPNTKTIMFTILNKLTS